ncbi:MAG: hypothetical protein INQ03_17345 [Candidatus Heimdallarchaeota archaeon]|nr:hypothetical protein [Candidatus Heimdallarchaeota archaeon]
MSKGNVYFFHSDDFNIYFLLITDRISNILISSMQGFINSFTERYASDLNHSLNDTAVYKSAHELIEKHFSFIPRS